MTKQLIASILISIIILVGAIFFISTRRTTSPPTQNTVLPTLTPVIDVVTELKKNEVTVSYTANGFTPPTVTIKSGMAIIWINQSDKTATINSDDHPTNRKFPELNLGRFAKAESLTHTFMKPGTYTYHNHLTPSQKGTVIVQ